MIVVFYCRESLDNINSMEYYRQDIEALKSLGHNVVICNRYRDIPLKFDMLYVWWWSYALYPVLLARLFRRPSVITGVYNFRFENKHAGGFDYFGRPWYQRLLISLATKLTNANLFISEFEYKEVQRYFKLKRSFYYPCAVSDEYFSVNQRTEMRSGLLNIAWSGRENLKRKGVWDILDAIALLKSSGFQVSLTLAGKRGDAFSDILNRIEDLGLQDCVQAIGEVSQQEKLDLLSRSKLYLQPSYYEGFGLATAEAMAAGCCVVTCDVGEVRNVVGDACIYIKPGQPAELADAVKLLLNNQNLINSINQKGSIRMRDNFSFARKTETLRNVLLNITRNDGNYDHD